MTAKKLNSYLELKHLVNYIKKSIRTLGLTLNELFLIDLGCNSIGVNIVDLLEYKYSDNYYLNDALGISDLPTKKEFEVFKENFEVNYSEELNKLIKYLNDYDTSIKPSGILNGYVKKDNYKLIIDYITSITIDILKNSNVISTVGRYFHDDKKNYFEKNGYFVIPKILDIVSTNKLANLTMYIAKKEIESGVAYIYGEENKSQRIYNLISKHPVYPSILEMPIILEMLKYYFMRDTLHHKYVLSGFQSNILYPGAKSQKLHVDGWGAAIDPMPSWPTRLNIFLLLTDWTENNGASLFYPGSHKFNRVPRTGEVKDDDLTKVIASKGSMIVWTGHTWHKGGANNSTKPRFGLSATFAASHLKEVTTEEEHLVAVDKNVQNTLSPELRLMIGLDRGVKKGSLHKIDFRDTEFSDFSIN
jgi:ectoine hydroxylase-related dioxygenase (phytanoyl-CoA dioxygenase family)